MWIISFLPDTVIHLAVIAGILGIVAGFFLGFIPFVGQYKLPIQVISIAVLAFALYLEGGLAQKEKYDAMVADYKIKIAEAEAEALEINLEVVQKVVTRTEVVKEKGKDIIKYIDRKVVEHDSKCEIPHVVIEIHNAAAKNEPIKEEYDN